MDQESRSINDFIHIILENKTVFLLSENALNFFNCPRICCYLGNETSFFSIFNSVVMWEDIVV